MWIRSTPKGVIISCQIQPRASRTEIVGLYGEPPRLKIKVTAPPVEGEANEEIIYLLSKKLKVAKSRIHIISGISGKLKEIIVAEISLNEITTRLGLKADCSIPK